MDIYASDEEKGEEIKQWWRDNGTSVIVGCLLGASILFGGRYWTTYQQASAENASTNYQQVIALLADGNTVEAENSTQQLLGEFAKTPYAVFAAFEMAKHAAANDDLSTTQSYLEWVVENAELAGQIDIAQIRLAQLLLNDAQYLQALALLEQPQTVAFESLFSELRGDIYAAQGEQQLARASYQNALLSLEQGESRQQLLKLKLDDMAVSQDG